MMPATLSTSCTSQQANVLKMLGATTWWQLVPIEIVESILYRLNQSLTEPSATRIKTLQCVLEGSMRNAVLFPTSQSRSRESEVASRVELTELVHNLNDAQIVEALEIMFNHPSTRLAVYGSLRPGESNDAQLAMVRGEWQDGTVKGKITKPGEYLEFTWDVAAPQIPVKVLTAACLRDHFDRLDEFEGADYRRILVPVMIAEKIQICHIYQGVRPATDHRFGADSFSTQPLPTWNDAVNLGTVVPP